MCDDYQPCAMLLHTLLCSTLDVTSPIYYQPCAQLYHCPAACLDQSLGFLNPTICRLSSQGDKYCDKIWQKSCLIFYCYCFVTLWDLWEQVDLLILFMKSEDARQRRSRRPRISWAERKSSKFEYNLLFSILDAFKKWSDHYSDELFKSDQFHLETGQK